MEFNETLLLESQKFRKEYPDLINLGIDIDEYLISIFNSSYTNKYHQALLRLVNAFHRNFLLSSFLFESKQWNVWVQAMRTMIESWELLSIYLFEPNLVYEEILSSKWKPVLDNLIRKYASKWIKELNDDFISEKANRILDTKTTLNNLLTHVNPSYNLAFASGCDFSHESWLVAGYTDVNKSQTVSNYLFLIASFIEVVSFISIIWPKTKWNMYLSTSFTEIPDFHLKKLIEKYNPDWLQK